ncbi:MAG: energy-coupling factor transporter ATPase [Clostridiales bacterium]|nr:energy-coupling factor transporter ATPase [Clostridiales bacterium]
MSIVVKDLNFVYSPKSPFEKHALININLTVEEGDFLAIIGHTGSGKSTFVQHLNGLVKLQSGTIIVDGIDLSQKKIDYKKLRGTVGMVFQYPEYQLFADTVYDDVAFGPKNLKLSKQEIDERVKEAIKLVGLDFDYVNQKSPFELSGGEKRRVALAGVLAMRPKILVLDEPTAGLDPQGKKEILDLVTSLHKTMTPTIIMINHDMDEVARYANKVAVFDMGSVKYLLTPEQLAQKQDELVKMGLDIPTLAKLKNYLANKGFVLPDDCITIEKMVDYLADIKAKGGANV